MAETHHELIGRLAHVLALLSDTDSITDRLCEAGRQMLDADGAAITLRMDGRHRVTVSATDDLAAKLEDLQDVVGEGPSIDAARTGSLVVAKFGDDTDERWSLMYDHGYRLRFDGTILAVPLRADVQTFGSLTVHRGSPVSSADDITGRFLGVAVGTALLQDPTLDNFSGRVSDSGEGRWTVAAAIDEGVPAPVISAELIARFSSRDNAAPANRVLSAMRKEFGGHDEKKEGS